MAKQVCDISGSSGMSRGQSTEHLRDYRVTDPDAKKYGYYDPTRVHLNFEITRGGVVSPVNKGYPIDKRFKDICNARGIKIPGPIKMKDGTEKERRTVANIILGGSRERMLKIAFGDQKVDLAKGADNRHVTRQQDIEKWAQDQYNLMCKLYGEENIVAFIVHLDEKNPHVHCTIIPEVNGKISFNQVFGGSKDISRQKFKNLHDAIAEVNKKWGLERGDSIQQTGAKHRTSEEYLLWLREQCNNLENDRDALGSEVDGLKESVQLLEKEIRRNEIKLKGLGTMVNNLTSKLQGMEQERQDLEEDILSQEYDKQKLEQQMKNLNSLMQNTQEALDRKRRDIDETKQLLEILKKQHEEKLQEIYRAEEKNASLRDETNKLKRENIDLNENKVAKAILKYIGEELSRFFEKVERYENRLPQYHQLSFNELISNTDLRLFETGNENILKDVLVAFLGGKDGTADVSMSNGGGGGPGGGWRKRKDEDDDAYLQRCIGMIFKFHRHKRR